MLWGKCKKLFGGYLINCFWVFNGNVNINYGENDGVDMKIGYLNDLKEIFPNYNFYSKSFYVYFSLIFYGANVSVSRVASLFLVYFLTLSNRTSQSLKMLA